MSDWKIPILLEEDHGFDRLNEPVTVGIPMAKGVMFDSSYFRLLDQKNSYIPLQTQVLSRWSDKSIKWLLVDFQASLRAQEQLVYQLQCSSKGQAVMHDKGISVQQHANTLIIDTGHGVFVVPTKTFKPFERVIIAGTDILDSVGSNIWLIDDTRKEYTPHIGQITHEAIGPLRSTLKIEGKFLTAGETVSYADFICRLTFYAHTSLVVLHFTLRNPQAAQHPGGFWDLGDAGSVYFRDLSIATTLASNGLISADWTTQPGQRAVRNTSADVEIYQDSSGGHNWKSPNHINRFGQVMHTFRGYRVTVNGDVIKEDARATPSVTVHDTEKSMGGAIDKFWQNFPKALEVHNNRLIFRLFPSQYRDTHELQGGEQKTHTIFLQFAQGHEPLREMDWVHHRLISRTTPDWYARSKTFHYLTPRTHDKNTQYLSIIDSAIKGENTFFDRRETVDEYGWRHFGDLYADHEAVRRTNDTPLVAHYNNQYDAIYGFIIQYVSTGDRRWFYLLDDLAKHVIDIDIYHTARDRQAFNGGMFWHTEHYTEAATSSHRAYSQANIGTRNPALCGGGPSSEHNYTSGLLHYYFLTGNRAAYETVQGLADWVINMDSETKGMFGLFDKRPTGLCSLTVSRDYHGPGRGCGNSINALLDAYILTHQDKYLAKAEQLIRRCIHPHDDILDRNLPDVEHRWSYTVFLQILGKYLDLKYEMHSIDYMYAYARESLLHYATWMLEHEVPYKDVLDRVEIPTETWPAQDIRKSNVFKFAAKYADRSLKKRFEAKSVFFFDRSIQDLLSFDTYNLTRPLIILITNGFMHAFFQNFPGECPPIPDVTFEFGKPKVFKSHLHELIKLRERCFALVHTISSMRSRLAPRP